MTLKHALAIIAIAAARIRRAAELSAASNVTVNIDANLQK